MYCNLPASRKAQHRAWETVQWLETLAVLVEDQVKFPASKTMINSCSRESSTPTLAFVCTRLAHGTHTYMHAGKTHTKVEIINTFENKSTTCNKNINK